MPNPKIPKLDENNRLDVSAMPLGVPLLNSDGKVPPEQIPVSYTSADARSSVAAAVGAVGGKWS